MIAHNASNLETGLFAISGALGALGSSFGQAPQLPSDVVHGFPESMSGSATPTQVQGLPQQRRLPQLLSQEATYDRLHDELAVFTHDSNDDHYDDGLEMVFKRHLPSTRTSR